MQEALDSPQIDALEAERRNLQALIGELLRTNQKLRLEVAVLKQRELAIATATHPQPLQDR
jgi:regulator of replication initiation timing